MRPLVVLGCTSSAGKSLLVTALARWFARNGVDVVPFKAQNMSNNARVVDGGEIGVAQWLQARAAGVEPDVRMNPVLLKPEAETRSQVVVSGVARHDLTELHWNERGQHLWPAMAESFDELRAAHELVVIEGAGSPAEINLPDLVNNRMLAHADAAAMLVADIDRGGAFAHLYGTWSLVPDATRDRLAGFVLNKFRGDADLLAPAPEQLAALTGMAPLGVVPMLRHELPDEEGATLRAAPPPGAPAVAVVRYPYGSNLDELHLLGHAARVVWATSAAEIEGAEMVVLPGSKHVVADARWMRDRGLDVAVTRAVERGARLLGICGGCMMLGADVAGEPGIDGRSPGLGLLPLRTRMAAGKLTRAVDVTFGEMPSEWAALRGRRAAGYEIRHGRVDADPALAVADGVDGPAGWAAGRVLGTTVHGLLEDPDIVHALFGIRPRQVLDETFELLADAVDAHLDTDTLWRLVER